ncbi:MAG: DUF423 domain-containing protein [Planctomycetes bacterium]|nr:DUF423 domain-containing protein [Planctomycetota bacterium]
MQPATMLRTGALLAGAAVAAGAIGAHALQGHVDALGLERFEKAVRYQMYHGLGLCVCAALARAGYRTQIPAWLLLAGTVLFSGSLYLLATTGRTLFAHVTPFGGVLWLVGWAWLVVAPGREPSAAASAH